MTDPLNHECLNNHRCQPGDQPRITETPNTLCDPCTHRARRHITQLPEQHLRLHAMLGEHTPALATRHTAPDSAVLINVTVDTLLTSIEHHATLAAEIIADHLGARNPHHHDATAHVHACCQLIAPNLHKLLPLTGIDIMEWDQAGTARTVTTTTGVTITQQLDHLSAVAHYTLGYTRARQYRDTPCARCRQPLVGRWSGASHYDCEGCGTRFLEDDLRRQDRILLELHARGVVLHV